MKKTEIFVVIAIMGIFLGLVLMSSEDKTVKKEQETKEFKAMTKSNFMGECTSSGQYAYCDCAFETLYTKYGPAGIVKLEDDISGNGGATDALIADIDACFVLVK